MGAISRNSGAVVFQGVTGNVTHISAWNHLTAGTFQGRDQLNTAQAVPARFDVDALFVRIADSADFVNANDILACTGRTGGITHIQAHSGDPGAAGTDNTIVGLARQPVAWKAAVGE